MHRILVVDDYVPATMAIAQLLRMAGHAVTTAYSVDGIVELAVEFQPDVVLLDLSLKQSEDGLVAGTALRKEPRLEGVVLVAMTGRCDTELDARLIAAGFDHYLLKPVGFDDIDAIVTAAHARGAPGTKGP